MRAMKSHRCFGGKQTFWEHDSKFTQTTMRFSTFVPEGAVRGCLIWLSGLTCTDENFPTKAGAQRALAAKGLMVVCPDTSPRGLNLPGEHDSWDFGSGAGFYLDATSPGYADHYRMYSYVNEELYQLVASEFGVQGRIGISGHSMGGHGALVLGLRNPDRYRSVSAFAPIANPSQCAWGKKAFGLYLQDRPDLWAQYDACSLLAAGHRHPQSLLVDQGTADSFLAEAQLLPEHLRDSCTKYGQKLNLRMQEGYDHSYYFIASFIEEHIAFHAEILAEG